MGNGYRRGRWLALAWTMVLVGLAGARWLSIETQARNLVPLEIQTPIPAFIGTPPETMEGPHIEKPSDTPRPPFLAPEGARNVALNKRVTLSDSNPINGSAELVTDGNKEAGDENMLELRRRLQWVQIDLGNPHRIYAIVIWHAHDEQQIVHDVIVQVADDADFTQNVKTVYNNDYDNSAGMGVGNNKEYFENYEGRLIDAEGVVGRYVRSHSQGSTYTGLNRWTEIEVYGLPAE
jgi:hypothetical protein